MSHTFCKIETRCSHLVIGCGNEENNVWYIVVSDSNAWLWEWKNNCADPPLDSGLLWNLDAFNSGKIDMSWRVFPFNYKMHPLYWYYY